MYVCVCGFGSYIGNMKYFMAEVVLYMYICMPPHKLMYVCVCVCVYVCVLHSTQPKPIFQSAEDEEQED